MTKEALKQEAEDKAFGYADRQDESTSEWADKKYTYSQIVDAYEQGAVDFAAPREKRIEELKQENTELRVKLQKKINTTTVSDYPYSALKLEEAKGIIERLLKTFVDFQTIGVLYNTDILKEAEQFLKEVDK